MIGVAFALAASLLWGLNGVLLRKGFERSDVLSGTLTVVGISYLVVSALAIDRISTPDISKLAALAAAGVISYAAGRVFTYASVAAIGSSRAFSGTSTRILFSALFGVLLLNESMTAKIAIGSAAMVLGLYIFSTESVSFRGLMLSVLGGLAYGIAALLIKIGMLESPIFSAFLATSFGFAALSVVAVAAGKFRFEKNRYLIAAGLSLGIGNVLYYLALATSPIIVVVPLSNLYPLVTAFLAYAFIQQLERVQLRTVLGALLTVAGSTLVALG